MRYWDPDRAHLRRRSPGLVDDLLGTSPSPSAASATTTDDDSGSSASSIPPPTQEDSENLEAATTTASPAPLPQTEAELSSTPAPDSDDGDGNDNSNGGGSTSQSPVAQRAHATLAPADGARDAGLVDQGQQAQAVTVSRTTLTTVQPTFTGKVAGFTTLVTPSQSAANTPAIAGNQQASTAPGAAASGPRTGTVSMPTALTAPPSAGPIPTTLLHATGRPATTSGASHIPDGLNIGAGPTSIAGGVPTDNADGTSSAASSNNGSSVGGGRRSDNTAAKAGIGLGIAAAVLLVIVAAWFLYFRHRKNKDRQPIEDDDEFLGAGFDPRAGPRRLSLAPRLTLTPGTTQLVGTGGGWGERRTSRGLAMSMAPSATTAAVTGGGSGWVRPANPASAQNPFGREAERASTPISDAGESIAEPVSPVSTVGHGHIPPPSAQSELAFPSGFAAAAAAAAAAAGAAAGAGANAGLGRKTSLRRDNEAAPRLTLASTPHLSPVPPSPADTEYSVSSVKTGYVPALSGGAAAIAAAGGPPGSMVHRVQLDFSPSMEDEMQLRAGQLVRLLHEYDDGWALCIRLDRTEQGVVPRTCLSARPVKPRQPMRGPPVKPQMPQGGRANSPTNSSSSRSGTPSSEEPAGLMPAPPRPQPPATLRTAAPYGGGGAGGPDTVRPGMAF